MKAKNLFQKTILALGHVMPGVMLLLLTRPAWANPTGMTVQSGSASASLSGTKLTVTAGNNAVLNWQSFNIASGETTVFNQPSSSSIVWNRINNQNPSQIYGSLQANGIVVLLNSSGFYFGPNSFVSAAGLVVSTANCLPPQNSGGGWEFNGPPPLASIVNYGEIQIGQGGSCYLIAEQVENHGDIEAPGGKVGLAAGQTVTLSERPDGRGMSMKVTLPQGSVDNYGTLLADGGTISLNARVVNQDGFIQANSVQNHNGVIELVAGDQLNLGANSKITAQGDASAGSSAGGTVTLKSENTFSDASGSKISVAGGANGGNGGSVDISAPVMPAIHSAIDGTAKAGFTGGRLLIDPDYIILDTSGPDSVGAGGTVGVSDDPNNTGTLDLNVNSAFTGFNQITLQAANDITLADGTTWNLSGSTGQTAGTLLLEAGRNIIFGNQTALVDPNNWSIALYAGVNTFGSAPTVAPGAGSIYMNASDPNNPNETPSTPNGYIQTTSGNITMLAGQDITVGTGFVNTIGGGSITAHALAGNIDTGGYAQGYLFQSADTGSGGYYAQGAVSGISTMAGGDVNLTAGGNVQSLLPSRNGYVYDGNFISTGADPDVTTVGAGAYGSQPGNFNIVAVGDVTGNYVVANGTGKIFAGVQMDANGIPQKDGAGNYLLGGSGNAGTSDNNLALNLAAGGWNVTAAQDIYLQEVRNPNGDFNIADSTSGSFHAFDYAPSDYVNLTAGNLVQLGAPTSALPRLDKVPVIYPGILDVSAGAGGVVLDGDSTYNQLILFPSPLGGLEINTTDGGSLTGNLPAIGGTPQIFNLIVSDSGNVQYNSTAGGLFGLNDPAATPVHLNSEDPVELNISGNMDLVLLGSPEAAEINVVGDIYNSRFQGMNLKSTDVTSINVGETAKINMENSGILNPATDGGLTIGGDIDNRSAFTSVTLSSTETAPDLSLLADATGNSINGTTVDAETLLDSFFYNPTTKVLTYQNIPQVSLANVLNLLQNLTVSTGQVDSSGNPTTKQVSVIDSATAATLLTEYNAVNSQIGAIPAGAGGFTVGGGGTFAINAANLDLGTTSGIQSQGVGLYKVSGNYPLANYFTKGPNIAINLTGDLTMYSTAIASLNGGDISVNAGGDVNVGSSDFTVSALGARGIYTTAQGDVDVTADGDINLNGSRIASYDGGDVTVESLHGNINAGSGGAGFVVVSSYSVDPKTGKVTSSSPTIPGSGILATTFPFDKNQVVGNILVETPNGNINASAGGIIQLPLNSAAGNKQAITEVLAGYELRDSAGNPVSASDLASGTPVKVSDNENIDASGSGIIGQNVVGEATGNFKGIVFGQGAVNLTAAQFTSLTVLGQEVAATGNLGAGDELIGTVSVTTSGSGSATILSENANGAGSSFAQGTTANATSAAASANDASTDTAATTKTDTGQDDPTKKKKPITLARKISRVTVLLPGKN
jgi:filamentous hemagglutinin family protein